MTNIRLPNITATNDTEKIEQISNGIEQIAAVVHNNSATAEQSAAASEELASQAALMKEQISKFKLYDGSLYEDRSTAEYVPEYESMEETYDSEYVPASVGDKY